jgi:hypothetical protein
MDPSQVNSFFETKIKDRFGFGLKKEQCKLISQILNGKNSLGIFPTIIENNLDNNNNK